MTPPSASLRNASLLLCSVLLLVACDEGTPATTADVPSTPVVEVEPEPPPAVVTRLTTEQVTHTLRAVFGADLTIPPVADSDPQSHGFTSVGGTESLWSPRGVESLEALALAVAGQVMAPERRDTFVPCSPAGNVDATCARSALAPLGKQLWRRPLTDDELGMLVGLADQGGETLGDFYQGLEFAIAALIQSPRFLFRFELGEPVQDGDGLRYTNYEMASRLAFVLWNRGPDAALLDAAEAGKLTDDATLEAEIDRMMAASDARAGLTRFFLQWLRLDELEGMVKDPKVFPEFSPTLPADALEETRLLVDAMVFDWNADIRELLTTRKTFINRKLASLYEVPAPALEGFGETELPEWTQRAGILGHASFLARKAHAASSSPTTRGVFVREQLLCQTVPLPPADVDTSIPETTIDAPTLRERLQVHFEDPACSSCHQFVDPIGLAFEHFDGIGRWRDTENGHAIDVTGRLDAITFDDHRGLAKLLSQDPRFTHCVVQQFYRFSTGTMGEGKSRLYVDGWHEAWAGEGFKFLDLVKRILMSEPFRRPAPPEAPETPEVTP